MAYATLMTLDTIILTNHGRTMEEGRDERSTEVQLASGRTKKYVKYVGKTWKLSWTWLPNDTSTVDGESGRDGIKALAATGTEKTLVVYEVDGSSTSYTVFIDNYSEKLLRRLIPSQRSYWEVELSLKEA